MKRVETRGLILNEVWAHSTGLCWAYLFRYLTRLAQCHCWPWRWWRLTIRALAVAWAYTLQDSSFQSVVAPRSRLIWTNLAFIPQEWTVYLYQGVGAALIEFMPYIWVDASTDVLVFCQIRHVASHPWKNRVAWLIVVIVVSLDTWINNCVSLS